MSSKEVGIEEARKRLGDIVTAVQQGTDVTLTRNGKPAARIVAAQEAPVSKIAYNARPIDQNVIGDLPHRAGSFDPRAARYWVGDGKPRRVEAAGEEFYMDREGERLWQTDDGRWIVTHLGSRADDYLVTDADAEQWFADNGYADDREVFARRL